jgi:iron complex outermembrane receptor protein
VSFKSGSIPAAAAMIFSLVQPAHAQHLADAGGPITELGRMSLEELASVEVTSVSKSAQSLSSAPASIYVITREEILRTGVQSIPEALRLAPNMHVTQLNSSEYSNGARGLAGSPDLQNFSNKTLILIDGRSVYSPLFSGVVYDMQDVLMDDIDRIEVISGPGATLWGANAMNGVINIITRKAADTKGALVRLDAGEEEQAIAARYGGALGNNGAFRVYAKWFDRGAGNFADGSSAQDDWSKWQAGFRSEFGAPDSMFTLQGDYQQARQNFIEEDGVGFTGANVLGRWEHSGAISTRVQVYFDRVQRDKPPSGIEYDINTLDFELQQSAQLGSRHHLIWGAGLRSNDYNTVNNALAFVPDHRTLEQTNLFVQDNIALTDRVKLVAGIKFEDNSYSDWSFLPDLRLSWSPNDTTLFWIAGSKAIRAPTPFDTHVQEFVGGSLFVLGDPDFKPEKVTAYEIGYRGQPDANVSFSASVFYDEYDDLRSIEITPVTLLPLRWGNLIEGDTYGVEAWANLQVNSWWRLSPGYRSVHKRLEFSEGASGLAGIGQTGNDPTSQYLLKSSMDIGKISFDAVLRKIGAMPGPALKEYTELSAHLGWRASERLEVAVKGFNLLNETHREFADPEGQSIRRSVMMELRYSY